MNDTCSSRRQFTLGLLEPEPDAIIYMPLIENDELILAALKKYQPVSEFAPGSAGARDFRRLAEAVRQLEPIEEASGGLQFFVERLVTARA